MQTASYLIAVVLGLTVTLGAVPAQAETTNCTPITAVPTTITVEGIYCFTQHLSTSMTNGRAIDIQVNNVVLDLNGWKLGGLAAGPGTEAFGIWSVDRQNITIKNGTVRGFFAGICLCGVGGGGHVVENIRAERNTVVGIEVEGLRNLIRNNQVVATGGSTVRDDAFGITVGGGGIRVLNNDVIDTLKQGTGRAVGIEMRTFDAIAVNNRIANADEGIDLGFHDKYRDNLTFNVTTPFHGAGINAGNNN